MIANNSVYMGYNSRYPFLNAIYRCCNPIYRMSFWKLGSKIRISGLYTPNKNAFIMSIDEITHLPNIDPDFLGHPSTLRSIIHLLFWWFGGFFRERYGSLPILISRFPSFVSSKI